MPRALKSLISADTLLDQPLDHLASRGLLGLGVPRELGGQGGSWKDADAALMTLRRELPRAALTLASQRLTIQALLGSRNIALRDYRLAALLDGSVFGIWPAAAMAALADHAQAPVQMEDTGRGLRLSGPLGRIPEPTGEPFVLMCPVQWQPDRPPGIALLDGEQDGLHIRPTPSANGAWLNPLAVLDKVFFREDELVESDASRLVMELCNTPAHDMLLPP